MQTAPSLGLLVQIQTRFVTIGQMYFVYTSKILCLVQKLVGQSSTDSTWH